MDGACAIKGEMAVLPPCDGRKRNVRQGSTRLSRLSMIFSIRQSTSRAPMRRANSILTRLTTIRMGRFLTGERNSMSIPAREMPSTRLLAILSIRLVRLVGRHLHGTWTKSTRPLPTGNFLPVLKRSSLKTSVKNCMTSSGRRFMTSMQRM